MQKILITFSAALLACGLSYGWPVLTSDESMDNRPFDATLSCADVMKISQKACNKTVVENSKKTALSKSITQIILSGSGNLTKVLNQMSCCVSLEVVECMANDIKVIFYL